MSINKVYISGNLADDCTKHGSSENPVVMFTVAVNDRVKSGDEWVEKPNFFDCKVFGNYAKALAPSLKKGTRVTLEGSLQQEKWEDKDGNKRSKVVIKAGEIVTATSKPAKDGESW